MRCPSLTRLWISSALSRMSVASAKNVSGIGGSPSRVRNKGRSEKGSSILVANVIFSET